MPTPAARGVHRGLRQAHQLAWSVLAGGVLAAGSWTAVQVLGFVPALLALVFGTIVFGSCVLIFHDDGPQSYRLGAEVGALVTCLILATAGVTRLVGPIGFCLPALLVIGWPGWSLLLARLRPRLTSAPPRGTPDQPSVEPRYRPVARPGSVDMTAFEASLLDVVEDPTDGPGAEEPTLHDVPTTELCREWRRTFVLLAQDIGPQTRLELLATRERCLAELMRREPAAYQALMASGATPSNDLSGFFHGSGEAAPG